MRADARRARTPKIGIWTSKIMTDLWLSAVFCQIKKKKITPPCCWVRSPILPHLSYTTGYKRREEDEEWLHG